jgi:hypothetical protein
MAREYWLGLLAGGVLGGAIAGTLAFTIGKRLPDKVRIIVIAAAVAAVVPFIRPMGEWLDLRLGPRALRQFTQRIAASPEITEAVRAHAPGGLIGPGDGARLVSGGLRRVSDELVVRRAQLYGRILTAADIPTCAAVERGTVPRKQIWAAVDALTPTEQDEWVDLLFVAMRAEINKTPPPPPRSDDERQKALTALNMAMDGALPDARRIAQDLAHASDGDVCKIARAIVTTIPGLPDGVRQAAARQIIPPVP